MLTILGFFLGFGFAGLIVLSLILLGKLYTYRGLAAKLQEQNAKLNQQIVSYATVTQNALTREEEFLKKPMQVAISPEAIDNLGKILSDSVRAALKDKHVIN